MTIERHIPAALKAGAASLGAYGVIVLAQALTFGAANGWADKQGLIRAAVRCAGTLFVAAYVLRLDRWAWYLAVAGSGILLLLSGVSVPFIAAAAQGGALPLGVASLAFFAATAIALFCAFIFLLMPAARAAVFQQAR